MADYPSSGYTGNPTGRRFGAREAPPVHWFDEPLPPRSAPTRPPPPPGDFRDRFVPGLDPAGVYYRTMGETRPPPVPYANYPPGYAAEPEFTPPSYAAEPEFTPAPPEAAPTPNYTRPPRAPAAPPPPPDTLPDIPFMQVPIPVGTFLPKPFHNAESIRTTFGDPPEKLKKAIFSYHPDRGGDVATFQNIVNAVNNAYNRTVVGSGKGK